MKLNDETIKQIFFHSDKPNRNAIIATEVDILQFARNIEAVVTINAAKDEHQRCVKIVSEMNQEVARALEGQRPK